MFDSSDAGFATISVWSDANGDGIPDATEIKTLAELGITSVGLSMGDPAEARTTPSGNEVTGTFTRLDGRAARFGRMRGMRLGPGHARTAGPWGHAAGKVSTDLAARGVICVGRAKRAD